MKCRWMAKARPSTLNASHEPRPVSYTHLDVYKRQIVTFAMTQLAVSATQIRTLLLNGRSPRYLLPEAVIAYIPVSYTHLDVYKRQPLFMAIWFAPALVFFNRMAPVDALKASFNACLKNFLSLLVYGCLLYTSRCV